MTIVAISTAAGASARMIIRLSGDESFSITNRLLETPINRGPAVSAARIRWRDVTVPTVIYAFVAPRSSTGEDVVELHLPGNVVLVRSILQELIALGAKPAEPGEFTSRAYFNGKIDLAQAEGVAATISAANASELSAAHRLLAGELARRLAAPTEGLAETLALVEAGIDFTDEDVTFISHEDLAARIDQIDEQLDALIRDSRRFEPLSHQPTVVLVGRPNAGKSTLLNALCGRSRAVVSAVAGTTRDAIWADVPLRRGIVRILDVAGIEPPSGEFDSAARRDIERQMQEQARNAVDRADVVVLVQEFGDTRAAVTLPRESHLTVCTKSDLAPAAAADADQTSIIQVSAKTGHNLDRLREALDKLAFGADTHQVTSTTNALALNERHRRALADARTALARAREGATTALAAEFIALELRESLDALGSIVGGVTPDDVLGRIFGAFCIGK